jgi:hypothetical protein
MGNSREVEILAEFAGKRKPLLRYRHEAPDLYLRGRGNEVGWSDDSTSAKASYRDIIDGEECWMTFEVRTDGSWQLNRVPRSAAPAQRDAATTCPALGL